MSTVCRWRGDKKAKPETWFSPLTRKVLIDKFGYNAFILYALLDQKKTTPEIYNLMGSKNKLDSPLARILMFLRNCSMMESEMIIDKKICVKQKALARRYGEEGLLVYALCDGNDYEDDKYAAKNIMKATGLSEARLSEIVGYLEEHGMLQPGKLENVKTEMEIKKQLGSDAVKIYRSFTFLTTAEELAGKHIVEQKELIRILDSFYANGFIVKNQQYFKRIDEFLGWNPTARLVKRKFGINGVQAYALIYDGIPLANIRTLTISSNLEEILNFLIDQRIIVREMIEGKELLFFAEGDAPHDRDVPVTAGFYTDHETCSNIHFRKGLCYYKLKRYKEAVEEYTKAIAKENKPIYHLNCGAAYFRLLNPKEAIVEFTKAFELDKKDFSGFYNRGLAHLNTEEFGKAVEDLTCAIEIKPDSGAAYYLRGLAHEYAGQLAKAVMDLEKADSIFCFSNDAKAHLDSIRYMLFATRITTDVNGQKPVETGIVRSHLRLSDVGGLENLKQGKIREILSLLKSPEAAKEYGIEFGGGILFFGPPGCGKSFVTEAVAGEANVTFLKASIADTLNMYVGNSEKNIRQIFEAARKKQPAIIFFDEIEALGASREGAHTNWERILVNQFLTEMDQIEKKGERILVIGATNSPWHIDHALKRSGRFSETIFIGPPDKEERAEIFRVHCRKIALLDKIDYKKLAELSDGFSGADIQTICKETSKCVWLEGRKRKIKTADFIQIIKNCKGRFNTLQEWFEIAKKNGMQVTQLEEPKPAKTDNKSMFG